MARKSPNEMGIWMGISFVNGRVSIAMFDYQISEMRFEHVPAWPDRQSAAERFRQHALPQDTVTTKMSIGIHWRFLCCDLIYLDSFWSQDPRRDLRTAVGQAGLPFFGMYQSSENNCECDLFYFSLSYLSLQPASVVILLANWAWRQYKTFGLSPRVWRQWQPRRPLLAPWSPMKMSLMLNLCTNVRGPGVSERGTGGGSGKAWTDCSQCQAGPPSIAGLHWVHWDLLSLLFLWTHRAINFLEEE